MSDPKKAFGASKPNLALNPPVAAAYQAMAHECGARKYGPFNWRSTNVEAMTYIAAIKRHIDAYLDGQDFTEDVTAEGVDDSIHNLGAVMAGAAILLDAAACGALIDNRPTKGQGAAVQNELQALKQKRASSLGPDKAREELCLTVDGRTIDRPKVGDIVDGSAAAYAHHKADNTVVYEHVGNFGYMRIR